MTALKVREVTLRYVTGGYEVTPVRDLSFEADDGELVLLLGASGCGKTTLLSALASLLAPAAGSIRLDDVEVTALRGSALADYRRRSIGVVFQSFNLLASLTAQDNVAMAFWNNGYTGRQGRARAAERLEQLGLEDRLHHRPAQLSGGQQQRVSIARALALDPLMLLADEPTAHLDHVQVESVLHLLRTIAAPGRIVVIATHDERLLPLADRVVELSVRTFAGPVEPIRRELAGGDLLFSEGDPGDYVYVVERGEVALVRRRRDGTDEVFSRVGPGSYFGELAPLYGTLRSATAKAIVPTVVVGYGVQEFRRVGGASRLEDHFGQTAQHAGL
jgi:putative ABC transport system ATP-binding protein